MASWRWAAVLAGALASGGLGAGGAAAGASAKAGAHPVVTTAVRGKLGRVLVTTAGLTLYHYTLDRPGKVACTGSCAALWPPLLLPAGTSLAAAGKGLTGLGTVRDPDGKLQLTYHGEPLYRYVGDRAAGQTKGQGLFGRWFVVKAAGASAGASSTASSSGSSGSGYGY